jgi:HSP20 family protein
MLIRRTPTIFERFFDDINRSPSDLNGQNLSPLALDVRETETSYIITSDVPGIATEDIDIRLHDNVLTINAEMNYAHEEEQGRVLLQERRFGKFSRTLRFPINVNNEAVDADYSNGVLTIIVPKAEEAQPRRIVIKNAS